MLAVAKHRDEGGQRSERRTWVHGKGRTKMADNSVDIVPGFVIHECPGSDGGADDGAARILPAAFS